MYGLAKRIKLKQPFKLISMTSSKSCSFIFNTNPSRVIPALLINTSIFENFSIVCSTKLSATSNFEISPTTLRTSPGYGVNSSNTSWLISEVAFRTILAPSFAKANAMPNPIPLLLPVTTTVLSINFIYFPLSFFVILVLFDPITSLILFEVQLLRLNDFWQFV